MLKSNPPILTSIKVEGGLTAPGKVPVQPVLPGIRCDQNDSGFESIKCFVDQESEPPSRHDELNAQLKWKVELCE